MRITLTPDLSEGAVVIGLCPAVPLSLAVRKPRSTDEPSAGGVGLIDVG